MPMVRMKRLQAMLAPTAEDDAKRSSAEAGFEMSFAYDQQGLVTIDMKVSAELPLQCQRSLQTYIESVQRNSLLVVIENVAEQDTVPESYEPVLVEERRLALADLVEEELLLAVPQVPRSPHSEEIELSTDGAVEASSGENEEPTHRPFEGLAGLMNEKADKGG